MVIQNFDSIFLKVDQNTREIYFPKDRFLKDSKISYIVPFFADSYKSLSPNGVSLVSENYKNNIYLDFFELGKDYKAKWLNSELTDEENKNKFCLNCLCDFDITKVNITDQIVSNNSFLAIAVIYNNQPNKFIAPVKDSITLEISELNAGIYKLSDFGGYQLRDKKIKQITAINTEDCYITIRTQDNTNNINEMPISFLDQKKQIANSEIFFDDLQIDTDNTLINIVSNKTNKLILTFKF